MYIGSNLDIQMQFQIDRVQRLVWSLALCVIAALALFYTYHVLDEFFDYQTVTHLTVRQVRFVDIHYRYAGYEAVDCTISLQHL